MRLSQLKVLPCGALVQVLIKPKTRVRIIRVKSIHHEYFIRCGSGAATFRMIKWLSEPEKYKKHLSGKWIYSDRRVFFMKTCLN